MTAEERERKRREVAEVVWQDMRNEIAREILPACIRVGVDPVARAFAMADEFISRLKAEDE